MPRILFPLLMAIAVAAVGFGTSPATGQELSFSESSTFPLHLHNFQKAESIQDSTKRILGKPEFSHFPRLKRRFGTAEGAGVGKLPNFPFGPGMFDGGKGGGNGEARPGNGGRGNLQRGNGRGNAGPNGVGEGVPAGQGGVEPGGGKPGVNGNVPPERPNDIKPPDFNELENLAPPPEENLFDPDKLQPPINEPKPAENLPEPELREPPKRFFPPPGPDELPQEGRPEPPGNLNEPFNQPGADGRLNEPVNPRINRLRPNQEFEAQKQEPIAFDPEKAGQFMIAPRRRAEEPRDLREVTLAANGGASETSFLGAMFHFLAWLCLGVILGLIAFLIGRAVANRDRKLPTDIEETPQLETTPAGLTVITPTKAPGEIPADIYVAQAQKLAQEGHYREAVAHLILGAMSKIERDGLVRFRQGLTHRDYVRAVRQNGHVYQGLRTLVKTYEPLGFGRRTATPEHFSESLAGYEAGFSAPQETIES